MEQTYFRKGFGLRKQLRTVIDAEYHSGIVERLRGRGYEDRFGDVKVRLAREFGFCYGVDRAVDYAYETVHKFPERRIFLAGEIIHNPHVNKRLTEMGIAFINPAPDGIFDFSGVTPEDVVIIPAFGVTVEAFNDLSSLGCIMVDTTCGSVLHVWKRVEKYAKDGFTAIVHGKYTHEESRATASQAGKYPEGRYLIVRDMEEARIVCDYIAARPGALDTERLREHFEEKSSDGFDPALHLARVGVANQTTMLASESMAIGREIHRAMVERHGEEHAASHFRSFGTICSATQERQDAILEMMKDPPDVMVVVGGYNSSNTNHLAHLCRSYTRTFHVADANRLDVETGSISHKPELGPDAPEVLEEEWLPEGSFELGITAGASTPDNKIGETLVRLLTIKGIPVPELEPVA